MNMNDLKKKNAALSISDLFSRPKNALALEVLKQQGGLKLESLPELNIIATYHPCSDSPQSGSSSALGKGHQMSPWLHWFCRFVVLHNELGNTQEAPDAIYRHTQRKVKQ